MSDITLNGVSVAELRRQKTLIQEAAAKFIAENLEKAKALVQEVLKAETAEYADVKAKMAAELLQDIEVVSGVSGCTFYLDYDTEYDSTLASQIEDKIYEDDNSDVDFNIEALASLCGILENMQRQAKQWHSSTC